MCCACTVDSLCEVGRFAPANERARVSRNRIEPRDYRRMDDGPALNDCLAY